MSFLEKVKRHFLVGLPENDNVDSNKEANNNDNIQDTQKEINHNKLRLDIGNPIKRIKSIKAEAVESFRNSTTNQSPTVTLFTKNLIYTSLGEMVEKKVNKGKPIEEVRLLFKRFLEDQIIDENMYSNEDLIYIKGLVSVIKDIKSNKDNLNDNTIESIITNRYFLNFVEIFDIYYGNTFMDYAIEMSYIICGYAYNKDALVNYIDKVKTPCFKLDIDNSSYLLLNEVQGIINNESPIEDKRSYVINKVSSFFERYLIKNEIPLESLLPLINIFNNINSYLEPKKVTRPINENTIRKLKQEMNDEDIQEEMFKNISSEIKENHSDSIVKQPTIQDPMSAVDSVKKLKSELNFIDIYGPLADPRNYNITVEDLESALIDIEEMKSEGFTPNEKESIIIKRIEARLSILNGEGR